MEQVSKAMNQFGKMNDSNSLINDGNSKYVVHCKCRVVVMSDKETQCNFYANNGNLTGGLISLEENVFSTHENDVCTIFVESSETIDNQHESDNRNYEQKDEYNNFWNFETESTSDSQNENDLFTIVPEYKCIKTDEGFKCEICGKISPTMAAYSSHHESHEERCNLCYVCGYSAENSAKLRLHVYYYETHGRCRGRGASKKIENCCDICNKTFPQYIKLMDHLNTHTKERPYHCGCGSCFGSHSNFIVHFQKFKCSPEGRSIPSYAPITLLGMIPVNGENSKRKRRTSLELNKITDKIKIQQYLPTSFKNIKNDKAFLVERKKYVRKKSLEITNREYICHDCSKKFPSAPKLRMHCESEHMERKFTCDNCKRKFAKNRLLRVHINQFHVEKYKCEECNLVFSKVGHKTHMQAHNMTKVKCKECGILISTRYIRLHMEKHSGKNSDSTFYCAICKLECQFKFYKEHLKSRHHLQYENEMKTKLNIIKFSCRRCDKIELDNIIDFTKHHGVFHCWSVKKQLEPILKLFDNLIKFESPKIFDM